MGSVEYINEQRRSKNQWEVKNTSTNRDDPTNQWVVQNISTNREGPRIGG